MLRISWNTQTTELSGGDLTSRSYEHTLEFDCVTSETHEGVSVLTEHAVESGAPISDHKRHNPDRVSIEAIVTNTPLGVPPPSGYGSGDAITVSDDKEGAGTVVLFSADFDRMGDVVDTLYRLRTENTPVTLSTRVLVYEDVQIISVTIPREPGDGDSFRLQIECQRVRVAVSRTVDSPAPREPRGSRTRNRGGQEAEGAEADRRSALQRIDAMITDYNSRRAAGEDRITAARGATGLGT